jgi:hypothetical protein
VLDTGPFDPGGELRPNLLGQLSKVDPIGWTGIGVT